MKHIIDKTSPDFDHIPMRLRESLEGNILLELDLRKEGDPTVVKGLKKVGDLKGIVSIEPESLAEIITDDTGGVTFPLTVNDPDELAAVARTVGQARRFAGVPAQYLGKTFEEYIATDVETDDKTGHRKYAKVHEELMDDDFIKTLLQARGVTLPKIAEMKAKFQNAGKKK